MRDPDLRTLVGDFRSGDDLVADAVPGTLLVLESGERILMAGHGAFSMSIETPARPAMARAEAERALAALAAPDTGCDDELAIARVLAGEPALDDRVAATRALRLGRWQGEHAAERRLADAERLLVREIALVLRSSERIVRTIAMRRDGSVEPPDSPRDFPDHDYLGSLSVGDELIVADRCYVRASDPLLALTLPAVAGRWHVYVRHTAVRGGPTIAMFAVHDQHLARAKDPGVPAGLAGVDTGAMMFVDGAVRRSPEQLAWLERDTETWQEGILLGGAGVYAKTTYGDGSFPVRVAYDDGRAVMVRVGLSGDDDDAYYTPPASAAYVKKVDAQLASGPAPRDYSPKLVFAIGDRVRHPRFGDGIVAKLLPDNKIEVTFRDGPRALVHKR